MGHPAAIAVAEMGWAGLSAPLRDGASTAGPGHGSNFALGSSGACATRNLHTLAADGSKILEMYNAYCRILQDGVDAVVAKLLVSRESRFERGLDFRGGIAREGDLIFHHLEARVAKYDAIVFTEVALM